MQQVLYTRDAHWQSNEPRISKGIRKNVSYNKYEDHIQRIEKELMKKHRLGYSALVKFLILKKVNNSLVFDLYSYEYSNQTKQSSTSRTQRSNEER